MVSFVSSSSFSKSRSFSNDDEVLYDMDQKATMLFHTRFIACTFGDLFTIIEMEEGGGHYVDPTNSVQDVLAILLSTPTILKNPTNFTTIKFEDLTSIVVPTIISMHGV
jgi:arabinogalactan endo-1,4-beta-galactosidase